MRYRRKPSEIHAVQWRGDNIASLDVCEIPFRITLADGLQLLSGPDGASGWVDVNIGDMIVWPVGEMNHYWPVNAGHFAANYEEIE